MSTSRCFNAHATHRPVWRLSVRLLSYPSWGASEGKQGACRRFYGVLALGAGRIIGGFGAGRRGADGHRRGQGLAQWCEPPPPLASEPVKNLGVCDGICDETEATTDASVECAGEQEVV